MGPWTPLQQPARRFYGGLVAAVVALPLALAFGVTSGLGAIAGLYGAIFVGFLPPSSVERQPKPQAQRIYDCGHGCHYLKICG
ncbi:MAG: SulP family inorganic anion transporter [Nitrospirales bacterium]|nr:SulP family inorganic anion transporter [Nitrospirales bacterium]